MTVKLLYLRLGPTEKTPLSQRQIARALGISQGAVSLSLARLRTLGLEDDKKMGTSGAAEHTGPYLLPEVLLEENPTAKLVYLYLCPHAEVEVSVRGLESLLGISHRSSTEALQRLISLGILQRCDTPANRPGTYIVNALPRY